MAITYEVPPELDERIRKPLNTVLGRDTLAAVYADAEAAALEKLYLMTGRAALAEQA